MKILKSLPKKVQYIYTTEDNFGVSKIYRSRNRIYLHCTSDHGIIIYSYTPKELQELSFKLIKYAKENTEESGTD